MGFIDLPVDMCVDIQRVLFGTDMEMCLNMCIDVFSDIWMDLWIGMCIDMYMEMCGNHILQTCSIYGGIDVQINCR